MQINITNGTVSAVTQTLTPTSGHSLPSEIVLNGATASYDSSTGVLTLTNLGETVYVDIPAISSFASVDISSDTDYVYLTIEGVTYQLNKGTAAPITFTVEGTSYSADSGMTWAQFVASAYNTNNTFFIVQNQVAFGSRPNFVTDASESHWINTTELIIANYAYSSTTP